MHYFWQPVPIWEPVKLNLEKPRLDSVKFRRCSKTPKLDKGFLQISSLLFKTDLLTFQPRGNDQIEPNLPQNSDQHTATDTDWLKSELWHAQ